MLWDAHMHTRFSGDSEADEHDMIDSAIQKGLSGICFTDHMDLDYPDDLELFHLDIENYVKTMLPLRAQYEGQIQVCTGIELGLQPQLADTHRQLLAQYPQLDFVIGSSHVVHRTDPYYASFFQGRTEQEAYGEYFQSILENIQAFDGFDVYGHLDYVVRYGPEKNKNYTYEAYHEIIDEILKALITRHKGIELNTAGFRYGLGHPNPTEAILKRYRELGGEILTIGSDAHSPQDIAWNYRLVPDLLQEAGFRYFTVFRNRKPEFFPLT
jgi:histidinol-phosphatase (PHP family)